MLATEYSLDVRNDIARPGAESIIIIIREYLESRFTLAVTGVRDAYLPCIPGLSLISALKQSCRRASVALQHRTSRLGLPGQIFDDNFPFTMNHDLNKRPLERT